MMRNLGATAVMATLAITLAGGPRLAAASCPPPDPCNGCGVLIEFDADAFAFETMYNKATFISTSGSAMTIVGLITQFGVPLNFLNPSDPNKEYTFVMSGLTSAGTVTSVNGPTTNYDTDYAGGTFTIYEGSPRNAITGAAWGSNPFGGATVPANFQDGTVILTGNLCGFHTQVSKTVVGPSTILGGSFRSNYNFTNPGAPGPPPAGNLFNKVGGGVALVGGNWCASSSTACTPANYTAQPNGKFDAPQTTATVRSSWGQVKVIYR
jgi:hypothetical protein